MSRASSKPVPKPIVWVRSSLDDLKEFPEEVQDVMGFALYVAQLGQKHPDAKPLKGFKGASVLEVADDFKGDTYRVVYTTRCPGIIYALHAFKKKAKRGIATPRAEMDLIEKRLAIADEHCTS